MLKRYSIVGRFAISAALMFSIAACNKIYEPVASIAPPAIDTTKTLAKLIEANPSYSIFTAALKRTGVYNLINVAGNNFTVYAPSDAAFAAAGISLGVVNAMPLPQLVPLIRHHVLQNEKLTNSLVPVATVAKPNLIRISALNIGTLPVIPSAAFPVFMPIFPSKNAVASYLNNIPVVAPDAIVGVNGLLHGTATVVAPPTKTLWDTIGSDPDLAYFKAAIIRADSGTAANSNFQYLLSLGVTSSTVFAPNNLAFQTILTGLLTQGLVAQGVPLATAQAQAAALASTPGVFTTPALYPYLKASTVQGIVAYHLSPVRFFSVNTTSTPTNYPTFVNRSVPAHPGIAVASTLVTGFGAALTVKGLGNATAANAIVGSPLGVDRLAVNGVFFKIDQVLLPQ